MAPEADDRISVADMAESEDLGSSVDAQAGNSSTVQRHNIRHSLHRNPGHTLQTDSLFCHQDQPAITFYGSPCFILKRNLSCLPAI